MIGAGLTERRELEGNSMSQSIIEDLVTASHILANEACSMGSATLVCAIRTARSAT
jgi:hypothetical protein